MMKATLLLLAFCSAPLFAAPTTAPSMAAPTTEPAVDPKPINKLCAVTKEEIDPAVTTVYQGKTVAFCCKDCVKKFKSDPAKYMKDIK